MANISIVSPLLTSQPLIFSVQGILWAGCGLFCHFHWLCSMYLSIFPLSPWQIFVCFLHILFAKHSARLALLFEEWPPLICFKPGSYDPLLFVSTLIHPAWWLLECHLSLNLFTLPSTRSRPHSCLLMVSSVFVGEAITLSSYVTLQLY